MKLKHNEEMDTNEMILRPTKYGAVFTMVASLIFVYAGVRMIEYLPLMGWLTMVFFGICLLVAIIQILPGASQLKLTHEGFEITTLFRSHFTAWEDVSEFRTAYVGIRKMVVFNYSDAHKKFAFAKRLAQVMAGTQAALPDNYGMKAAALAVLMIEWKERATKA